MIKFFHSEIYIYNKLDVETGERFWNPIIQIMEEQASDMIEDIKIINEFDDLVAAIKAK